MQSKVLYQRDKWQLLEVQLNGEDKTRLRVIGTTRNGETVNSWPFMAHNNLYLDHRVPQDVRVRVVRLLKVGEAK